MEIGAFILRNVIGRAVSRTIPVLRSQRARIARGRCFRFPRGKTYILIPEALDYESAMEITRMFSRYWYEEGRDWQVIRTAPGIPLSDEIRRENLIILGGPDQNPVSRELMQEHPGLFRSIRYHGGATPEFRWHDRAFRANESTDFAFLFINRNVLTSQPHRRLVLIFGLTDAGTLAGARLFGNPRYAQDRRELQREFGTLQGNLEVLLHVSRSAEQGEIRAIRAAPPSDGVPFDAPPSEAHRPLAPFRASLARIYDSLEQHRRGLVVSDLRFTLTVTRDFSLRIEETATLSAERQDVIVFTKAIRGTPLAHDEDIEFTTEVVDGDDDQACLPAEILESERRFLVFPLPPLLAGGRARRIRISALWPRACRTLQEAGGEDLNSVQVSEHAGPNVDRVAVRIRFEVQDAGFQVFERFSLANAVDRHDTLPGRRRIYDIHTPYEIQLVDLRRGTTLEFRIVRVARPETA
ncbi:MAG TPA: hypothetical protein VGX50_05410 [Longimicrobium sp.]|jgi:hypothetical protein|nr:hypothetical protein [Longimicrobium sp.]